MISRTIISRILNAIQTIGLSIFLSAPSAPALASGNFNGGGGGHDLALEFKQAAQKAIQSIPHYIKLADLKVDQLQEKLDNAKIVVSDRDLFVTLSGIRQEAAAVNYPGRGLVVVNRPAWSRIQTSLKKEAVALHEILSLMGVESTGDYRYSQKYYEAHFAPSALKFSGLLKQQALNRVDDPLVTIVVYEDLLSPFVEYNDRGLQAVLKNYGDRVKVVVRNFPITVLHEASQFASLAGICANDQNQFPIFRAKLLLESTRLGAVTKQGIESIIQSIPGLDLKTFSNCVKSPEAQVKLDADLRNVEELQLTGSPSMTLSSKYESFTITGARKYEEWESILNKLLSRKDWSDSKP